MHRCRRATQLAHHHHQPQQQPQQQHHRRPHKHPFQQRPAAASSATEASSSPFCAACAAPDKRHKICTEADIGCAVSVPFQVGATLVSWCCCCHLMLLLSSGATLVNSGAEISLIYHPSKDEAAHQKNGHSSHTTPLLTIVLFVCFFFF